MASGNTLAVFSPGEYEAPTGQFATLDKRNARFLLNFDSSTQETALWTSIMPGYYSTGAISPYVHWAAASATTGTIGWDVALERVQSGIHNIDTDGFSTAQIITAIEVPASGLDLITNTSITGGNLDGILPGELYRFRLRRDVANDTAPGDAQVLGVELRET